MSRIAGKITPPAPRPERMLDYFIYALYRAGTAAIGALPLTFLFRLGNAVGLVAWLVLSKYRALALRNVRIAFAGEKSERELRRLIRDHFRRLGANLLCGVKMSQMPLDEVLKYVELGDVESAREVERSANAAVVVLGHIGNWEALAQLLPVLFANVKTGTIYQRLENRRIDEHVRRQRARGGLHMFDRDAFGKATDFLRSRAGIGVLSDQHAGDQGIWTPFFGRLASTTTLPALLAKRSEAMVLSGSVNTIGVARWRLSFTPRIDLPDDSVESITAKANAIIEQQIRAAPEDWFWVHNRWKTPKPNFLLRRYKRGIFLPPDFPAEKLKPFRILIRAPNWLGDSVISSPAVRAIKRGRPDAHVTVLAPEKTAEIWKLVPEVDEIVPLSRKSLFAAARAISARQRFDVAILFPNSFRAAAEVWLAGVPRRVGVRGHQRSMLLNQIIPERPRFRPIDHQLNDYLHLARTLGAIPEPFGTRKSTAENRKFLGLCPGAEYGPAKRWLPERFAEAAQVVAERIDGHWLLFGTKTDTAVAAQIENVLGPRCTNLAAKTTLAELIERLRDCALLLTNDTGTMHVASLLGVPVVAVFGSTEPGLTGPLGERNRVIRHHVECSPCFLRECPIDFRCMHAVTAGEVVNAVLEVLDSTANDAMMPRRL
ncbi:MAG: lipopolysaccharide heptosyltransferase II [Chthoniobacterales bacterium]